jgi:hypothetical protein
MFWVATSQIEVRVRKHVLNDKERPPAEVEMSILFAGTNRIYRSREQQGVITFVTSSGYAKLGNKAQTSNP